MRIQILHHQRRPTVGFLIDHSGEFRYFRIQHLSRETMQVHVRMGDQRLIVLIPQTDIIQLHVLDGYQAVEGAFLLLLFGSESINEELVIPRAVRQAVYIRHDVLQPHM